MSSKEKSSKDNAPTVCRQYAAGNCKMGSKCRFQHSNPNRPETKPKGQGHKGKPVCRYFSMNGKCRDGDNCNFIHEKSNNNGHGVKDAPVPADPGHKNKKQPNHVDLSADVSRFWLRIHKSVVSNNENFVIPFKCTDPDDHLMWLKCWQVASTGAVGPEPNCHYSLLRCYQRMPDTAKSHPPAANVIKVLIVVCSHIATRLKSGSKKQELINDAVAGLMCIADVVRDRLSNPLSLSSITNIEMVSEMVKLQVEYPTLVQLVSMAAPSDINRISGLYGRVSDFVQYQTTARDFIDRNPIQASANDAMAFSHDVPDSDVLPWLGWRDRPTVGWLMSESWHHVPGLKNKYQDESEYAEGLLRMWVLLTFYWGAGAVWPRCVARQGGGGGKVGEEVKMCGEPLLACCTHHDLCSTWIKNGASSKICGRPAVFRCHRMGPSHGAVCSTCLQRQQNRLAGEPSPQASTDVYDALVDREHVRKEGTVFCLSELKSRKPPAIAPNWRTSYRLQSSVLVAVVRLSMGNEPLSRDHVIQWAEIVPYSMDKENNESARRESGRIAVRILGRGDCSSFQAEADNPLEPGARVALIDLRVFVPEVVSVLATFANDQFAAHLKQIPFMNKLIGTGRSRPALSIDAGSIQNYVNRAVFDSEIECIRMLSIPLKNEIVSKIVGLKPVQSLYGTQLEAFANSLYAAIHCSQGPPGTGKSYVGVCLVLALVIIRKVLKTNGSPVGPILMLSYKNHALDEFLHDVLNFSSDLQPGKLIRCGKCENPALVRYGEKNSPLEQEHQLILLSRIATLRKVRKNIQTMLETARNLKSYEIDETEKVVACRQLYNGVALFCNFLAKSKETLRLPSQTAFELVSMDNTLTLTDGVGLFVNIVTGAEHWLQMPAAINKIIADLRKDLNIIHSDLHLIGWILAWFYGLMPPPRCGAVGVGKNGGRCMNISKEGRTYCDAVHGCTASITSCNNLRNGHVPFCVLHNCQAKNVTKPCILEKLPVGSYCSEHVCTLCLETGQCKEKIGLYACQDHSCRKKGCMKMQLFPNDYCEEHACTECILVGTGKALEKCNNSTFCRNHKCQIDACFTMRMDGSSFCAQHTCHLCDQSVDLTVKNSQLCVAHRCGHTLSVCYRQRLECQFGRSDYCVDHSCKTCIARNTLPSSIVSGPPPRNCCALHPLCQEVSHKGILCENSAELPNLLCTKHLAKDLNPKKEDEKAVAKVVFNLADGVCCGVTKKYKRCQNTDKNKSTKAGECFFCNDHLKQKPAPLVVVQEENDVDTKNIEVAMEEKKEDFVDVADYLSDSELLMAIEDGKFDEPEPEPATFTTPRVRLGAVRRVAKNHLLRCNHDISGVRCALSAVVPLALKAWKCALHKEDLFVKYRIENVMPPPPPVLCKEIDARQKGIAPKKPLMAVNKASPTAPVAVVATKVTAAKNVADDVEEEEDVLFNYELVDGQVGLDPDEMDLVPLTATAVISADTADAFEDDAEQIHDDQLRRREIGAIDDESDDDQLPEEDDQLDDEPEVAYNKETAQNSAKSWSWDMAPADRLIEAGVFLRSVCVVTSELRVIAEEYVMEARRDRAEASAQALKNARIVGATVVGASRRLEAIRAAEPFAVVVEEACEVMEPTLISVLAVKSLRKLELVGDHRQLPAFVQQCWYNMESTLPSIKTSLFERLISGAVASRSNRRRGGREPELAEQLPCSILDEQRRMRSSIADITRPDYEDIVTITDHGQTALQVIGDHLLRSKGAPKKAVEELKIHKELWVHKGRHVPGMQSNIFFWNLKDHKESRPIAGLSACNEMEANAVTGITRFLLDCGVPASSISIITPYKGQKTLITRTLSAAKCIPKFNRDNPPPPGSTVFVSTVDRYQGDENDIVILSLVRSRPGNRFVALLNRFIVAVSRARLGFYIVGSVDAVTKGNNNSEGPSHWIRFVDALNGLPRTVEAMVERNGFMKKRVGSVPVCCPRHRAKAICPEVGVPSSFPTLESWNKVLCKEICTVQIACGHDCNMMCHSPTAVSHTQVCRERVERPCTKHPDVPLVCCDVERKAGDLIGDALGYFKCRIECVYQRKECQHTVRVECDDETQLSSGKATLKPCLEIVMDYIHPACGHITKAPTCDTRRKLEKNPPKCNESVHHTRNCGCKKMMKCFERQAEILNPPLCTMDKNIERPRCGHMISMRCKDASYLKEYCERSNASGARKINSITNVEYGSRYLKSETEIMQHEATIPLCQVSSNFLRECNHLQSNVPCCVAFDYASGAKTPDKCMVKVLVRCRVCWNCSVEIPCHLRKEYEEIELWKATQYPSLNGSSVQIQETNVINNSWSTRSVALSKELMQYGCRQRVELQLMCDITHVVSITCADVIKNLIEKKQYTTSCTQIVNRQLSCNHLVRVKCSLRNEMPPPLCRTLTNEVFTYDCGEHTTVPGVCVELQKLKQRSQCNTLTRFVLRRCGHITNVACYLREELSRPLIGSCVTNNVVEHFGNYCAAPSAAPICKELVSYRHTCGHVQTGVMCNVAFDWALNNEKAAKCQADVEVRHPLCPHDITIKCWMSQLLPKWQPWTHPPQYISESFLDDFGEPCERQVVPYTFAKPVLPTGELKLECFPCNEPAVFVRECQHQTLLSCTQAFCHQVGTCQETEWIECDQCQTSREIKCSKLTDLRKKGLTEQCNNKVEKKCTVCHINNVSIACSRKDVECKSLVVVELDCGHVTSWRCGVEVDPRQTKALCKGCLIPEWSSYLEHKPGDSAEFERIMRDKLLQECQEASFETLKSVLMKMNWAPHHSARRSILTKQLDIMENAESSLILPVPAVFGSTEDIKTNYKLVFVSSKDLHGVQNKKEGELAEEDWQRLFTTSTNTEYGSGIRMHELSKENLKIVQSSDEGTITICVGIAFTRNMLHGIKPFATAKNPNYQATNRVSLGYREKGYCSVHVVRNAGNGKAAGGTEEFIYWTPGAVIPLAILTLRRPECCQICFDFFAKTEGFRCDGKHFVCWGCFEHYVDSACKPDAVGRSYNGEGNVLCVDPKCKLPYSLHSVAAANGPKAVFQKLVDLQFRTKADKEVGSALEDQKKRLEAEFARIQKMEGDQKTAHLLKFKITEEILNLKCPRCKQVFVDFNGCFALTCGNRHCSAGFCAWCLKDCGHDAHGHVPHCKESLEKGQVFSTEVKFNECHNKRRKVEVEALLKKETPEVQKIVKEIMRKELIDLGIAVAPAAAPAPAAPRPAQGGIMGAVQNFFNWGDYDLSDDEY